jgi:hypothetical protein
MGSPPSAKRERDSDSPISLQSSTSTGSRAPPPPQPPHQQARQQPQQPPQQPQRASVSPTASSLGGGGSGTPFVDQLYSHASEAFAQPAPPDIMSHPTQTQGFAYAHLPTHSDELARVPGHVFQPGPESWLAPPQAHPHRHQHPGQHAAASIYGPPTANHQGTPYGTPPGAEAYTTFVAPQPLGAGALPPGAAPGPGQGQDENVDIWHTVPSGYECVLFPFYSGAGGARVGDWLIGGTASIG